MSDVETTSDFPVRLRAARLRLELDQRRGQESPEWVTSLVEEGERREREGADPTPL